MKTVGIRCSNGRTERRQVLWLATLAVLSCTAGQPAARAESGGIPCVWRTRLAVRYHDAAADAGTTHDTEVFLSLANSGVCVGSGLDLRFSADRGDLVQGHVYARGTLDMQLEPGVITARYDKSAHWPKPVAVAYGPHGGFPFLSKVGHGFAAELHVVGRLTGTEYLRAQMPDGPVNDPNDSGAAKGAFTRLDTATGADEIQLHLTLDPSPGVASDPAGNAAGVPKLMREMLATPGGEALHAYGFGTLLGAVSSYSPAGDLQLRLERTYTLDYGTLAVDYVGWVTRDHDDWTPDRLPPLDRAAPP